MAEAEQQEFQIFSHGIKRSGKEQHLFFALSCSQETPLARVAPKSIRISERMGSVSPIVAIDFIDLDGKMVNSTQLSKDAVYYLDVGNDLDEATRIRLSISRVSFANQAAGESRNVKFTINFVHHSWPNMINRRYNRSWKNKTFAEIVSNIADRNYEAVDVKPTDGLQETIIQPHWSNVSFLKWIAQRASTANQKKSHIEFGVKLDGEFFFKSIGDIIDENITAINNNKLLTLKMQGVETNEKKRHEENVKNNEKDIKAPTFFTTYIGNERYLDGVSSGAGGFQTKWFDFKTGQYVTAINTVSGSDFTQLTDWVGVKKSHQNTFKLAQQGSQSEWGYDISSNNLSNIINSLQQFDVAIDGSPFVHIGDMVELIIPSPVNTVEENEEDVLYSEYYSGFYVIGGTDHVVNLSKNVMNSALTLTRSGFDGKGLEGYAKTTKGRFI